MTLIILTTWAFGAVLLIDVDWSKLKASACQDLYAVGTPIFLPEQEHETEMPLSESIRLCVCCIDITMHKKYMYIIGTYQVPASWKLWRPFPGWWRTWLMLIWWAHRTTHGTCSERLVMSETPALVDNPLGCGERSIRSWTIHWSHLGVPCRGIQDCPGPGSCRNEVHEWIPSITMYYYSILFLATFAIWDDDHDDHDDPSNFHDLHWYCDFSRGSNMFKTPFNNRLELVRSICQGRRACTGWNWQSCMELSGPVGEDWTSDGNEFQWEYIEYLYIYIINIIY